MNQSPSTKTAVRACVELVVIECPQDRARNSYGLYWLSYAAIQHDVAPARRPDFVTSRRNPACMICLSSQSWIVWIAGQKSESFNTKRPRSAIIFHCRFSISRTERADCYQIATRTDFLFA